MRGGPLHSKRIGYRFRKESARLISPALEVQRYHLGDIRKANLRAGIAEASSVECPCGLNRAHKTGSPGCELRSLPR